MSDYLPSSCYDKISKEGIRYNKKENSMFVRDMYLSLWNEYINLYGVKTDFYVHGYDKNNHNFLYGEDPTAEYEESKSVNMMLEFQSDALMLAKFGIETNADVVAYVSVEDFRNIFGINKEPKSGDVIELVESAWEVSELPKYTDSTTGETTGFDAKTLLCHYKDRETVANIIMDISGLYGYQYVRHPQLFEITEIRYQEYTQPGVNFLQGHYVWKLHAKRFDYSFEPGIRGENPTQQVYDNDLFGSLSGDHNQKPYTQNTNEESKKTWDYEENDTNTSPYGYY